ncbi:MAG: TadE/TadG family type IV pilus assembly protein, partial [Alphaproteobacteria bacterium]
MLSLALLRRFLRCRKGVSALEFALVAPILLLTITGVIDLMMVMFVTALMEGGLRDGSRLGRTGFQPAGTTREQAILDKIEGATIGLVDMNNATVTTLEYEDFGSIGQPEEYTDVNGNSQYDSGEPWIDTNGNGTWDEDQGLAGIGSSSTVVLYTVRYTWRLLTPLLPKILPGGSDFPIEVSLAVRNEPWSAP